MHTNILFPTDLQEFESKLSALIQDYSQIVILADSNTLELCWPIIAGFESLHNVYILEVPAGEDSKDLDISHGLWAELLSQGLDRSSLLINLGGGMVTDLGGFVASVFKRGIEFIHIPTSYLAMVDAAIGGKTGVNFNNLKNQIGTFSSATAVIIWPGFLETLPARSLRSGFAETLKHALIADPALFSQLESLEYLNSSNMSTSIEASSTVKCAIVETDFEEKGNRKKLNFGHTLGHAIESHAFDAGKALMHGEAIALGMLAALYLSKKLVKLNDEAYKRAIAPLHLHFSDILFDQHDLDAVLEYVKYDKKNSGDSTQFVLLTDIGTAVIDVEISVADMREALSTLCVISE